MNILHGYNAGINLGMWLEWAPRDRDKLQNWIIEKDIEQIASWGMDHIRLPFSYRLFCDESRPVYSEEGLSHLDKVVHWCAKHGLNLILDLHQAPGYSFANVDSGRPNPFLEDSLYQDWFCEIWTMLARRYHGQGKNIVFELLNEIVEGPSERWNRIVYKAIQAIRGVDRDRTLIYGGIYYNSIYYINELEIFDDPAIVYNFHFYEPQLFTHQLAWPLACKAYNRTLEYPGRFPGLEAFLDEYPEFADQQSRYIGKDLSRETMQMDFEPVIEFQKAHPECALYCGEFGVIKMAPTESRRAWFTDAAGILNSLGIGHAAWSYKDGDDGWFALVDKGTSDPFDVQTIKLLSSKV